MDNQHREFRIGIMVLAALVSLVFLTVFFGKQSIMSFGDEYTIRVRFQRTPGISKNSPVFKNGVRIGRVSDARLVDDDREVEISILLPKGRKIYTDEECRVRQTVIMGDASLEFIKKANYTGKVEIVGPDAPPLVGGAPSDLMSGFANMEGDLVKAINNVSDAAVQMGDFVDRINHFVGTPDQMKDRQIRLDQLVDEMRLTMRSVNQLTAGMNRFVNDEKVQADIRKVIESMPEILERSRGLIADSHRFFHEGRTLMQRSNRSMDKLDEGIDKASYAFDNISGMTDKIKDDVPEVMDSLKKSAAKLESLFDELGTLVRGFNEADGSLKRLMRNPEMYEKLMTIANNVEQLTGEFNRMLQTDVKPITHNVKIITDKVARDPSVFIRNLIRKQPPIKGGLPVWGDGLGSDTIGNLNCGLDKFRQDSFIYFGTETIEDGTRNDIVPPAPILAPDAAYETEEIRLSPPIGSGEFSSWGSRWKSILPVLPSKSRAKDEAKPVTQTSAEVETIPAEGRVVHVDPRYTFENGKPVYKLMSHGGQKENTPGPSFAQDISERDAQ